MLLSLHPTSRLRRLRLSAYTREGLAELQHFHNLLLLAPHTGDSRAQGVEGHHRHLVDWMRHLPQTYTAQLGQRATVEHGTTDYCSTLHSVHTTTLSCTYTWPALMGWFLTLTSAMTGFRIPDTSPSSPCTGHLQD